MTSEQQDECVGGVAIAEQSVCFFLLFIRLADIRRLD